MRCQRRRLLRLSAALAAAPFAMAGRRPAVAVVGGGLGGLAAARLLKREMPQADVTLVERQPHYLSAPHSNFALIGAWPETRLRYGYGAAAAGGIKVVHASAVRVAADRVQLADGSVLRCDRAVVAPGIGFKQPHGDVPLPHGYLGDVGELRRQLAAMPDSGVFIIVPPPAPYRCSPAPYDRAGMVAHYMQRRHPRGKVLILDSKEQFAQQTLFSDAWDAHYRDRIEWLSAEGGGAVVEIDARRRAVHTEFGEERGDVINYIPPQQAAAVAFSSGLADASGWCPVAPATMESAQQPGVYVIGDAAALAPAPKTGSCAISQAAVAAAAIARELSGREAAIPDSIGSICFSHIAPEIAFAEHGRYRLAGKVEPIRVTLTARGAPPAELRQVAAKSVEWQRDTVAALFGGGAWR